MDEFHYDLLKTLEEVKVLRVTGDRDETWGVFPTERNLVRLTKDQVPVDVRGRFPTVTESEAEQFGTLVGRKVHEESS